MSICNLLGCDRPNAFLLHKFRPSLCPLFFFLYFFTACNLQFLGFRSCIYPSRSLSAQLFLFSHFTSFSLTSSLASISVAFKNLINVMIAFLFPIKLAIYFLSAWPWAYHIIPLFSSLFMNFWHSLFNFWYLVYKCLTNYIGSMQH